MELSKERVQEILGNRLITTESLRGKWIVTIDGKLYNNYSQKFMFDDRTQAVRALHDCCWTVNNKLIEETLGPMPNWNTSPTEYDRWRTERNAQRSTNWKEFKKELLDHHDLKIIQL